MKHLVDTNILSEARRPGGHPSVRAVLTAIDDSDLFLSVITVGEIANGVAKLAAGRRRDELKEWLAQIEQHFSDRVLPVDQHVARLWGELTATVAKAGRTLHAADGLIAATALHHRMRLVTRNTADFEATGVVVVNPLGSVDAP